MVKLSVKVEMKPVIDIWSLADELEARYRWGLEAHSVCQLMFGDQYYNDSFKSYWFAEDDILEDTLGKMKLELHRKTLLRASCVICSLITKEFSLM